jgi:AraC-like DNA-binding protein
VDGSVDLPDASNKSFWLDSSAWPIPSYENADTFVNRLMRQGLLLCDPVVASVVRGEPQDLSRRSIQRHFLRATGLTHGSIRQIERARYATMLLQEGASIQETVGLAGYADQPHLTRTLKRFMGKTPAQIINKSDLIPNRDDKAAYSRVGRRGLAACGNSDFPESYREAQA